MPCIVLVVTVAALAARGRCAADMGVVERPGVIGLSLWTSLSLCVCVRVCVHVHVRVCVRVRECSQRCVYVCSWCNLDLA